MPHVGDGDIHAYLDGALELLPPAEAARIRTHLTDCPDCAARLEGGRELKSRSDAILAGSGPAVPGIPSFEEIRVRAAATGSTRGRPRRSVPPALAWAASLILALGTGWAARGVLMTPAGLESEGSALRRTAVASDAEATAAGSERSELEVAAASPEPRAEGPPRPPERARNESAPVAGRITDRIEPAGERLAEAEESASGIPAPPAPAGPASEAFADVSGEALSSRKEAIATPALGPPRQDADAPALAEAPQVGQPEDGRRARRADQPLFLPVGGGTIMISGLEVRSVEFDSSPRLGGVRIVQVLPGGEALELFYLRFADGSADEARAREQDRGRMELAWPDELPSGWSSAVLQRDGGWLFARSPIGLDSLNALIGSLR